MMGTNGAGKSTLLKLVAGLHRPDAGEIWLGDRRLDRPAGDRITRAGVVLAHQVPRPFPLVRLEEDESALRAAVAAIDTIGIQLIAPTASIAPDAARLRASNISLADGFALATARTLTLRGDLRPPRAAPCDLRGSSWRRRCADGAGSTRAGPGSRGHKGPARQRKPRVRGVLQCAEEDSNLHGIYIPQGPQPCEAPARCVRAPQIAAFPCRLVADADVWDGLDVLNSVLTAVPRKGSLPDRRCRRDGAGRS